VHRCCSASTSVALRAVAIPPAISAVIWIGDHGAATAGAGQQARERVLLVTIAAMGLSAQEDGLHAVERVVADEGRV
jgi:hypothetical protein